MHRLLIVEDDAFIRRELAEVFIELGYEVTEAADGRIALEKMRAGPLPCVVLLDLMAPRMNGWEFRTEQLKDSELRDVPVLLLSGVDNVAEVATTLKTAGYLKKPYHLAELLAAVETHCCRSG